MSSVAAGVADEERGVLDLLVDDKAIMGAQKPPDDVHKARALGADGGAEESLSCDEEMPRGDGVGRKRRRSRSCDDAVAA